MTYELRILEAVKARRDDPSQKTDVTASELAITLELSFFKVMYLLVHFAQQRRVILCSRWLINRTIHRQKYPTPELGDVLVLPGPEMASRIAVLSRREAAMEGEVANAFCD